MSQTPQAASRQSKNVWKSQGEVGSLWGIAFTAKVALWIGRGAARLLLRFVALYFFLTQAQKVALTRDFRRRVGAPSDAASIYRQFLYFAECALDRMFFLMGKDESFRIYKRGHDHMMALLKEGKGAILLGCHLGSFEALRAASRQYDVPLSIVADFENARRLNAVLGLFGDNQNTRFLDASGDPVRLGLSVKEAIDRGEIVAILADRAGHGRSAKVEFLGEPASFPVGAYLLASMAKCPVYFTTSIYSPPRRYELICEPFSDSIEIPRGGRDAALRAYAQKYAQRLEHYAKLAPDNWFNFYEFWSE